MRLPRVLAALAIVLAMLAGLRLPDERAAPEDRSSSHGETSSGFSSAPSDEDPRWRQGLAATATVTVSPWRVHELHAQLAARVVFAPFGTSRPVAVPVVDSGRPHAPPHFLNDSLLI